MTDAVFWSALAVGLYVYAGYPVLLVLLRAWCRRPVRQFVGSGFSRTRSSWPSGFSRTASRQPSVTLLIAAYNEEPVIGDKIRSALALDYPADRLEILVASDGSTDRTNEIVAGLADGRRVRLLTWARNRGKVAVLNDAVPEARGEIVAFSDAASMLEPDALGRLVAAFADPSVGVVSGVYRVRRPEEAALGRPEDFYWRYETFLKTAEAEIGSMLGAHGSLYAIRKALYPFPPACTINDDYVIPTRILQRGYRTAYEPAAVAYEDAREMGGFSRRVRIMAGNFAQLRELGALLRPFRPLPLVCFLSHKLGRLLVPPAMIALFISNALLLDRPLYRAFFVAQLAFYGLVLLGSLVRLRGLLRLPYYFCLINAAAFVGLYHVLRGGRQLVWKRQVGRA